MHFSELPFVKKDGDSYKMWDMPNQIPTEWKDANHLGRQWGDALLSYMGTATDPGIFARIVAAMPSTPGPIEIAFLTRIAVTAIA